MTQTELLKRISVAFKRLEQEEAYAEVKRLRTIYKRKQKIKQILK